MEQYLLNDASLVKIEPEDLECILNEKTPPVIFPFDFGQYSKNQISRVSLVGVFYL